MHAAPAPAPASASTLSWLKDAPFDLTLTVGIPLLAIGMGLSAWAVPALFLPLLAFHTWCFGFDHVIATFTKLAGARSDRRRNRFLIFGLPPLVFAALLGASTLVGVGGLNTAYFLFQWFHTTRQSWGVAQHYRRAAGGMAWDPPWLSELTLWSVPVVGILRRCHEQPAKFLWMELRLPYVPAWLVVGTGAIAAALVALFVVMRVRAWRRGERVLPHTLYFATHLLIFALAYLVVDDLHAGWLLVNVWHNVQYLAYVWMHNRARFADRIDSDAPLLSWICQPGAARAVGYFAGCVLISTPLFAAIFALGDRLDAALAGRVASMTLLFALTLNFHHYLVDGIIWKRRRPS